MRSPDDVPGSTAGAVGVVEPLPPPHKLFLEVTLSESVASDCSACLDSHEATIAGEGNDTVSR